MRQATDNPAPRLAVRFTPCYFAPVSYYARMAAADIAVIDTDTRYDKRRKEVHRTTICDTHGRMNLTVPVSREGAPGFSTGTLRWKDVSLSDHGQWWHVHLTALESAYGRTPFFEYYIDRIVPLLQPRSAAEAASESIVSLALRSDAIVRSMLHLPTPVVYSADEAGSSELIPASALPDPPATEYYQIWAGRYGFIPDLSVLDLLFNMGPESQLVIDGMARAIRAGMSQT